MSGISRSDNTGEETLTFSTSYGPANDKQYSTHLDLWWLKLGTEAKNLLSASPAMVCSFLFLMNSNLCSFHLAKHCLINGENCVVAYQSDDVRSLGPPTVFGDVAKANLLLYNVTQGDVESDVPQKLRGVTFSASTDKAATIKDKLPSKTDEYCYYSRPLVLARGTSQEAPTGVPSALTYDRLGGSELAQFWHESATGTGPGWVTFDPDLQTAAMANRNALGDLLPTIPTGLVFSPKTCVTYVAPPVDPDHEDTLLYHAGL